MQRPGPTVVLVHSPVARARCAPSKAQCETLSPHLRLLWTGSMGSYLLVSLAPSPCWGLLPHTGCSSVQVILWYIQLHLTTPVNKLPPPGSSLTRKASCPLPTTCSRGSLQHSTHHPALGLHFPVFQSSWSALWASSALLFLTRKGPSVELSSYHRFPQLLRKNIRKGCLEGKKTHTTFSHHSPSFHEHQAGGQGTDCRLCPLQGGRWPSPARSGPLGDQPQAASARPPLPGSLTAQGGHAPRPAGRPGDSRKGALTSPPRARGGDAGGGQEPRRV